MKGSTDIDNAHADLFDLLTGAMAAGQRGTGQAGNGVTASVTDRWVSVDGTNRVLRSQDTTAPFVTERTMWRGMPRFAARATGTVLSPTATREIGRPTFNGAYSGGTARVYFAAFVSTTNATPGSLTGTVVTWVLVNADTGATVTSGTASAWSGATDTKLLVQGVSLTLTFTGSEQFVAGTNAIMWLRAYSTTFVDGVDYFPEAPTAATTPTLSNTSLGANAYTNTTDYDLVQSVTLFPQVSTTTGFFSAAVDWGGNGALCGIAWDTTGTPPAVGATYFIHSYTMYLGWLDCFKVTTLGGNRTITGGPLGAWDSTLSVARFAYTNSGTLKTTLNTTISLGTLFTGIGAPTSTFINFWISVKSDRILMVLRGDGAQSGRTVVFVMAKYQNLVATDTHPWVFFPDGSVATTPTGAALISSKYQYENDYYGLPATTLTNLLLTSWFGPSVSGSSLRVQPTGIGNSATLMPDMNPNNFDLRWWLYSIYMFCNIGGSNVVGTFDATRPTGIRGKLPGFFAVADDNFTSLDELIDSSNTYLLVLPTSAWSASVGQSYIAIAILES